MNHLGDTNKMVGEDHIRDATKMVSDTPRTDENTFRAYTSPDNSSRSCVSESFARQLERELNAANDRIKRLEEFVEQLTNPKFTRDDLPKEALLQRIKRLEEAGDKIVESGWSVQDWSGMCVVWAKAKEAKP